jgi:hypothetical protein
MRHPLEMEFVQLCAASLASDPGFAGYELGDPIVRPDGSFRPTLIGYQPGAQDLGAGRWSPDRGIMVELAARRIEVRSRYWDPATQAFYYPGDDVDWITALRKRWPGRLQCEVSIGLGWLDLLIAYIEWHDELGVQFEGSQIKEKFGGIRIYGASDHPVGWLELYAECLSVHICEDCGAPGKLRRTGWHRTLCDEHAREQR